MPVARVAFVAVLAAWCGCDAPSTKVVVDNDYAAPLVVERAFWQAVAFATPIAPGASSEAEDTVAASANSAYVVLSAPSGLVVLQSRAGFAVHTNQTLHIGVDDDRFAGNCAVGSTLSQDEADFITTRVFADLFAGLRYDAATCMTSSP